MKYVYEIKTPVGTGYIAYGEFMPEDGRKNLYHCWWNGGGIGGKNKTKKKSHKYLMDYIKKQSERKIKEIENKAFNIRLFLKNNIGE